eukprot:5678620-Prymnesium_polylepis.1
MGGTGAGTARGTSHTSRKAVISCAGQSGATARPPPLSESMRVAPSLSRRSAPVTARRSSRSTWSASSPPESSPASTSLH